MTPKAGTGSSEVPIETQVLFAERAGGEILLLVPLLDGAFRCSLQAGTDGGLVLVAESGDDAIVTPEITGLFLACGDCPFALAEVAAKSVAAHLKTGQLREEKQVPEFVEQFGWCTWDAFYQEVSQEKVREGLESFRSGGVNPRYLILDDGWQAHKGFPTGDRRLTSFAANEKFPGDLGPTIAMTRQEFEVETFLVWHAVGGYWGGVDDSALPGYGTRVVSRQYSPGINHYAPTLQEWFGTACGVVSTEGIYRFYQDYHRHLREQGVDGVKVDNQASLEGVTYAGGFGGRVELMRRYHEALEGSVQTHFKGNLINCMSCANEMLYSALNSTLTRTSTDFWPNRPESHGLHLYCNAQVSHWFGEFVHPDWDMFQSGHAMGSYHAAGRAVGGCPVYVSDKPDAHDFAVLKKLVLPDGSILRADFPGRPTRDCLFHDPTKESVLLKIWNRVDDAGIIGVFHARYEDGVAPISGVVCPHDVPGLEGEWFAVYAHHREQLRILEAIEHWALTLDPLTAEVLTLVPMKGGFAPIGIAEYFNSYGAVDAWYPLADFAEAVVYLRAGGTFLAASQRTPTAVLLNNEPIPFTYDAERSVLRVPVAPFEDVAILRIVLEQA